MTLLLTYIQDNADAARRTTEGGSRCMMEKGESAPPSQPTKRGEGCGGKHFQRDTQKSPQRGCCVPRCVCLYVADGVRIE